MEAATKNLATARYKNAGINYGETDVRSRKQCNRSYPFAAHATSAKGEIRGGYPKAAGRDTDAERPDEGRDCEDVIIVT
jgi:hypothetical protein